MAFLSIKEGRLSSKKRPLTVKMLSFIDAYLGPAQGNGDKAIQLSQYECKTKYSIHQTYIDLMDHPAVKAEIDRRLEKREKKSEVKAEYLLNKLIDIIDDAEASEKTTDRLRAIELAGRAIALWKDRQEISGPDGEAIKTEQHIKESVADFTSRISSLAKRAGEANVVEFPKRSGTGGT